MINDSYENNERVSQQQEKIYIETKRVDDALLHALSLVLSANGEYARSVSALLEADLERDASLSEAIDLIKDLVRDTQSLIKSQEELKSILGGFSQQYSSILNKALVDVVDNQKEYLDEKFIGLFKFAGLKEDGTEYPPADKVIVKLRSAILHQLWLLASGGVLFYLANLISKKFGG